MDEPVPLFTPEHPSYETQVHKAMARHPAGKQHLTPVLQVSGAPKPVRVLKRIN